MKDHFAISSQATRQSCVEAMIKEYGLEGFRALVREQQARSLEEWLQNNIELYREPANEQKPAPNVVLDDLRPPL